MRRFHWRMLVALLILAIVAAGCTSDNGGDVSGGNAEAAQGAPTSVEVALSDFKIDPAAITVAAGHDLTFNVMNDGQSPHTFGIKVGSETIATPQIDPGATATLAVPALEAGSYDALCTVPGHDQLGMVATVTAGGDAPTGGETAAGTETGGPASDHSPMTAEEMAAEHEAGVKAFLAGNETDTAGNQPLEPEIDGDVKVFSLTVSEIKWEVSKGNFIDAYAFNGQVPGPEIRVQEGDKVRFEIENQMRQPFVLHFHGLRVPNDMDGVPYITQPPIMPGEHYTYEFTIVDPPGFYVYHSHFNSAEQVDHGLYGAIIVEPKAGGWKSVYGAEPAVESTLFLGDGALGYNLNAKSFPATSPVAANNGDWVLFHLANEGQLLHPMHLHGFHFEVVGVDGYPLAAGNRYMLDTLVVAPGQRYDILVHADNPGAWAFHCHILPHVEGPQGMFGMVTALVVAK